VFAILINLILHRFAPRGRKSTSGAKKNLLGNHRHSK
jgi:hypothetical protein